MPASIPKKKKPGLYANVQAKRKRIAAGSGEIMRKPHSEGAPADAAFRQSERTARRPAASRRHSKRRRPKARARGR